MPTPSSLFASAIPISSLKLAGIKNPLLHPFSSHSYSIPLPHLHGVSRVHAILHSFTYPLKPLTQAPISIQPTKPASLSKLSPTCGILPRKMSRGSLSLAHTDGPPCDVRHGSFHPRRNSVRPTFTFSGYLPSGILSGRRSTFSRYLTSRILSGRRSTFSGYLTFGILSADVPPSPDISHPEFCLADVQPSPDVSYPELCPADDSSSPDTSQSAPDAGWERKAIKLSPSDMSGSFDSTYPESICSRQFRFPRQLGSSDTRDSPNPFPPRIKKQTPIILTTKSLELFIILE